MLASSLVGGGLMIWVVRTAILIHSVHVAELAQTRFVREWNVT
jgi:hypothetical protein